MNKRMAIAAGSLLAALLAAEIGARLWLGRDFVQGAWVGPPQALCGRFDAELGWANREGSSARVVGSAVGAYDVAINSRGCRGPERDYAKPEGTVRIALLGDSTAWGWGVDGEQAFARLVERALGPDVEVINLAVPGYATDQELLVLESEGRRYEPDIVLLALVHNDLWASRFPEYQGMGKPHFTVAENGALELANSPVPEPEGGSDLSARYTLRRASTFLALARLALPPPPAYQRPDLESENVRAGIRRFWDDLALPDSVPGLLLARMKAVCDELGAPLFVFVLPHLHDRYLYDPDAPMPEDLPEDLEEGELFTHGSVRLAAAGERIGFGTFSVDRALLEVVSKGVNLDCGDEHLNARGNEIVAGVIARHLRPVVEGLR